MRRRPFELVASEFSHDTLEALRELTAQAERGELIGVAFAAMRKGRKLVVETTGEMRNSPIFTLGALRLLDSELNRMVHQRKQ